MNEILYIPQEMDRPSLLREKLNTESVSLYPFAITIVQLTSNPCALWEDGIVRNEPPFLSEAWRNCFAYSFTSTPPEEIVIGSGLILTTILATLYVSSKFKKK